MIVGLSLQTYYSLEHAKAAAYFARRASRLERRGTPTSRSPRLEVVARAYASATLFTAVAFLEALANELFADAAKPDGGHLSALDPTVRARIAELGETDSAQRAPVMSKFDVMLKAARLQPVSRDCYPGQDLLAAIRLRNELVHYKAQWFDMGTPGMARAGNFPDSKLAKQIHGRFEDRPGPRTSDSWLGAGCARWAVSCALAYADEFFKGLSVTPYYEHVRGELAT